MPLYTIDIGAAANDGTGDPLRTAFNETNLNFEQVFAAGPVLSNVQIANNTILTTNTNGNLVLAPNGIGVVQANVNIVPNTANIRNLGAADRRWSTVYVQYANVSGGLGVANLTATGNVTVGGNLSVTGNIVYIGNLITDAKTIQLANTAGTANAANGSGITVGANDNIATMLYSSATNAWTFNIGVDAPNIVVNNITSDDSTFVTIQDGLDVQGDITAETLNVAGNVTGNYILGNISQATGFPATYGNSNVATFLAAYGSNTISTTGNVTVGNILPSGYVSATGNVRGANFNTDGTVSAAGNVTGNYFIGNGSQLTSLPAPTVAQDITSNGAMSIMLYDGNIKYNNYATVEPSSGNITAGNISTTGNIAGNYFVGNGSQLTGISTASTGNLEITGTLIEIAAGATETSIVISPSGPTGGQAFVDVPDNATANTANLRIYNSLGNIELGTNSGNSLWSFGSDGNLTVPTPAIGTVNGINGTTNASISLNVLNNGDSPYIQLVNYDVANANPQTVVQISPDAVYVSTGAANWSFNDTGNLNLPDGGNINFNGGGIAQALNEDFYIRASDDENDGWSIYNVVDDGAGNTLSHTRLEFDQYTIRTDAQGAAYTWAFRDTGVLDLPGDIYGNVGGNLTIKIGDSAGSDTFIDLQTRSYVGDALISNIRIANPNVTVSTANAVYNWTFDSTGNLNLPPSGNIVGITANNNGYINWLGNSSGDLNGYTTLRLVPDDTRESSDQYLIVDPTAPGHIHIRAGGTQDNSGADLFLGGENSYFRVASGANSAASVSANSYVWTYGTDGTFSLPAAESPGQYSEITSVGNSSGDGNGYATLQLKPDASISGDSYLIIDPTAPNHIHIRAGGAQDNSGAQLFLGGENSYFLVENGANSNVYVASNSNQWKFDTTGILTLPGEGVLQSLNDTVTLSSLNTTTGNANSVYLGSSGGLGFNDQAIGGNWLEIFRSGSDPEIRVPPGGGNILITGASGSGGAGGRDITITAGPADQTNYYTTAGGTVNIVGGLGATDDGGGGGPGGNVNITAGVSADPAGHAGNVNITCGPNSWVFDYSGNVTIPGNINAVMSSPAPSLNGFNSVNAVTVNASGNISGNTAGYAIGYRDIPQVSFTGNATIATTDAGKHFYSTQSTNYTLTIANNASQGFQVGAAITVVNQGTGTISIAQGSGVTLYLAGNATSGNRSVATFGMATIMKVDTDTWFINGTGVS
jgi:hypothetical protein